MTDRAGVRIGMYSSTVLTVWKDIPRRSHTPSDRLYDYRFCVSWDRSLCMCKRHRRAMHFNAKQFFFSSQQRFRTREICANVPNKAVAPPLSCTVSIKSNQRIDGLVKSTATATKYNNNNNWTNKQTNKTIPFLFSSSSSLVVLFLSVFVFALINYVGEVSMNKYVRNPHRRTLSCQTATTEH